MDGFLREDSKHVSKRGNMRLANCPSCRGVLFKDFAINSENGEASFTLRCPHCKKDAKVTIDIKRDEIDIREL